MPEVLDAVVIGAGPAGLSCALSLAQRGFNVAVLEKEARPNRGKLCAGYVPAGVLQRLSLPRCLGGQPVRGVTLVSETGEWIVDLGATVGCNIEREKLAEHLAARLEKEGGELVLSTVALGVREEGGVARIHTTGGELKARVVVAADGAYSRIAASVRGRFTPGGLGLAAQVTASGETSGRFNTIFLGKRYSPFGYAWAFPKPGRVDVGVGALASKARGRELTRYLERALERCGCKPLGEPRFAPVPLSGPLRRVARGRVLLAGDAAGHVSPLTGEGIRFALEAGALAAEAAARYLGGGLSLGGMGRAYLAGLWRSFYPRLLAERALLRLLGRGALSSGRLLGERGAREAVALLYLDAAPLGRIALKALASRAGLGG